MAGEWLLRPADAGRRDLGPPSPDSPVPACLRWASASDQRAQTLEDNQELFAAGLCSEAFSTGRPAVMHDATLERRWGEIALTFVEVQIRSGLSVPVELGGGPIGTLDLYAADPRGWDDTEIIAAQAYVGIMAALLLAAAKAELTGALADQLQIALDSRGLIERAKGALMERERLDEQEAFTHLRRAARSSGRKLSEVAGEVAAGRPLPRGRTRPTPTPTDQPTSTEPPRPRRLRRRQPPFGEVLDLAGPPSIPPGESGFVATSGGEAKLIDLTDRPEEEVAAMPKTARE